MNYKWQAGSTANIKTAGAEQKNKSMNQESVGSSGLPVAKNLGKGEQLHLPPKAEQDIRSI